MVKRVVLAGLVAVCVVGFGAVAKAQAGSSGMAMAKPQAPPSTSLTLMVDGKATVFSTAELKAMAQKTVQVHNAHTNADETYSGVPLGDLLVKAGFVADKTTQQKMLRSYLRVEGTDKYWAVYSLTEVEGSEHDGDVMVATSMNGGGLGADGELKLVSTEDKKPQRWVRNLTAITLKSAE
ncbi:MAG: hypothetical protein ABSG84_03865 [Acidobacteriaceae bacterium]|jgi:hypothetical protein